MKAERLVIPALSSLAVAVLLLTIAGVNPASALWALIDGSFGSWGKAFDTLLAWAPLALAAAGLAVTFNAGIWNIGVEGQIIAGAIGASWIAQIWSGPGAIGIPLALLAGFVAGIIWGLLTGILRIRAGVNEIFGGLGFTFVAQALATYLILGPWARSGTASTSGTEPFDRSMWMPEIGKAGFPVVSLIIASAVLVGVWYLTTRTRFGLHFRAVGSNIASARLVGLRSRRTLASAFAIGGGIAGLAGALIALGLQHKLVASISGGRGYLGILVAILAGFSVKKIAPIALFFAAISVGSFQLNLRFGLDSSLAGVLQGVAVLTAILMTHRFFYSRNSRITNDSEPVPIPQGGG